MNYLGVIPVDLISFQIAAKEMPKARHILQK